LKSFIASPGDLSSKASDVVQSQARKREAYEALVERMKGKPFVLLGIDGDDDRERR